MPQTATITVQIDRDKVRALVEEAASEIIEENAALRRAVDDLYAWIEAADPISRGVQAYITDPDAARAAARAIAAA